MKEAERTSERLVNLHQFTLQPRRQPYSFHKWLFDGSEQEEK
jgi:hypothetical protein